MEKTVLDENAINARREYCRAYYKNYFSTPEGKEKKAEYNRRYWAKKSATENTAIVDDLIIEQQGV